mgnify:CR=1 FL=1
MCKNLRSEVVELVDRHRRGSRFVKGDRVWVKIYDRCAIVERPWSSFGKTVVVFSRTWHVEVPDEWLRDY